VKHIEQRTIALAVALACSGLLASCGAGRDDSATPSSLPFEETATSVSDSPATPTSAPAISTETTGVEPQLSVEMFEGMLETEAGRGLLSSSIASELGIESDAAECLLDTIPVETMVEAAGSFLGGETDGGFFSSGQAEGIAPLLESCGIAPDALLP